MLKNRRSIVAVPLALTLASSLLQAADSKAAGVSIFDDIKYKGEIRPRYEYANVKANKKDAGQALTARTHLSFTATLFGVENLSGSVGVQSVNNFGYTNYSLPSTNPKKYDVINDPQAAMISEASIDYKMGKTKMHAGRSQLNIDNQRFIGTVGWRQLERSYDTVSVKDNSVKNLELMGAWLYGYAGVGGTTTTETSSAIIHASYKVMDELKVTAYGYLLASRNDTYGLALTGKADVGAKLSYRAEYAIQKDPSLEYRVENVKADASYINLDLGAVFSGVIAGVNYESLSGSDASGKTSFNPALGTNHKFNGWADVFYVGGAGLPAGGLNDANLRLGYKAKGLGKVLAVYHDFKSNTGSENYGSEIDALYANKIPGVKNLKGLLKAAFYTAGDGDTTHANANKDKTVFWAQLDYKF